MAVIQMTGMRKMLGALRSTISVADEAQGDADVPHSLKSRLRELRIECESAIVAAGQTVEAQEP